MHFATYLDNGVEKVGVLNKDKSRMVDISKLNIKNPQKNMLKFIENCDENTIKIIKKRLEDEVLINEISIDIAEVKICASIPIVRNDLICLGLNYIEHVKESKEVLKGEINLPEFPIYFSKRAYKVIGPYDEIDGHFDLVKDLDYEVELAIIIGKDGTNIPIEKAEEYIFGYTILNDISARDLQNKHHQWMRGKSLDTFTVMGPYIVHKSEIAFPVELNLYSKVNEELRQNSNTKHFIFDIPYIISDISQGMTLKAGDIISTGTPSGVGMGFKPPRYLKSGDVIECGIEKIGKIINRIK